MKRRVSPLVVLLTLCLAAPAIACLWDYDAIKDEQRGLPSVAAVLAGRWEKHSAFFYEDRVRRMREKLSKEPSNWAAHDNLAVALEKLGRFEEAIAQMQLKEKLNPGQYTTYANLGTFYMHMGKLDPGIEYIRKALAINPNAHFGREEYQLQLGEYLREGMANPLVLQKTNFLRIARGRRLDDHEYGPLTRPGTQPTTQESEDVADQQANSLAGRRGPELPDNLGLKPNVFDGVVGMIRFGTGKSAELYLTLGDLLALRGDKHLAYRAYQRALDLHHPRRAYLEAMIKRLPHYHEDKSGFAPELIAGERAEAEAWVAAYQKFEDDLIRAGQDPDVEANLAPFYSAHGMFDKKPPLEASDLIPHSAGARVMALLIVAAAGLLAVAIWRRLRRKRAEM